MHKPHPSQRRPRDASTLIIVRNDDTVPRFIMGKRHENSKFMPGKFVFPGGRVDACDSRVKPVKNLHPLVEKTLLNKMRGKPSALRARALAMAAIRETFEEVGLVVGKAHANTFSTKSAAWEQFADTGYAPSLENIRFLARAITPPGRPRRYDTRFLVVDAGEVANIDQPVRIDSDELLECHWVSFADSEKLDLPFITRRILEYLQESLHDGAGLKPGTPRPFQYMNHGKWCHEKV